jgi:hypothetical protein
MPAPEHPLWKEWLVAENTLQEARDELRTVEHLDLALTQHQRPHGLTSEAAAGFRSRRGPNHDSTFVTPHNAPFSTYKAAEVHHAHRRRGGWVASRWARAAARDSGDWIFGRQHTFKLGSMDYSLCAGIARAWLGRGPHSKDRVSLG